MLAQRIVDPYIQFDNGPKSGAFTLDRGNGEIQAVELTGAVTWAFAGFAGIGKSNGVTLFVLGANLYASIWPANTVIINAQTTISLSSVDNSVNDSALNFADVEPYDSIVLSGTTADGVYPVRATPTPGKIKVVGTLPDMVEGPSVTVSRKAMITEGGLAPEYSVGPYSIFNFWAINGHTMVCQVAAESLI